MDALPNDTMGLLRILTQAMLSVKDRLAPDRKALAQVGIFPATATPGSFIQTVTINGPFNSFLTSIKSGSILVFWGSINPNANTLPHPDMVLGPTTNPLPIYFGSRQDRQVTFFVDPKSAGNADGNIYVQNY